MFYILQRLQIAKVTTMKSVNFNGSVITRGNFDCWVYNVTYSRNNYVSDDQIIPLHMIGKIIITLNYEY